MKKILCCVIMAFTGLIVIQAQELKKSLLWEISGMSLEKSSYLYGTIHMSCEVNLNQDVQDALDETTLLVLELDMDDPELQRGIMSGVYMKDDQDIKNLVSEEDYDIISTFVKEQIGMPLDALSTIKPFFITAMFYPKLLGCPIKSYEQALMDVAHQQNEEVLGLETVEEQLEVFDQIPYSDQAADLLRSAKDNLAYDKESFERLLEYYSNQDIEGMIEIMEEDKNLSTTKHRDKMLDDRNKKWISKIGEYSIKQPTFYGVGAAHLAGENGLIKLLRKAGYTVEAVN